MPLREEHTKTTLLGLSEVKNSFRSDHVALKCWDCPRSNSFRSADYVAPKRRDYPGIIRSQISIHIYIFTTSKLNSPKAQRRHSLLILSGSESFTIGPCQDYPRSYPSRLDHVAPNIRQSDSSAPRRGCAAAHNTQHRQKNTLLTERHARGHPERRRLAVILTTSRRGARSYISKC